MSTSDPSYTVFIRLPFPRGDFVDPPAVEWDAAKDKALWKILSKASKNSDIDWSELATKFEVSLAFLLQQAAWLYERQLLQVRAQMRKVGVSKGSSAPSPIPGSTSETAAGEAMRRTGSGGGRIPSALSARRDSPIPKADGSGPNAAGRWIAPPLSRTSSANTTVQTRNFVQTSPRPVNATIQRSSLSPRPISRPPSVAVERHTRSPQADTLSSPAESSSSESSSDSEPTGQSRLVRRPARFSANKLGLSGDADDDEDGPAFLPFAATSTDANVHHDPSATLRGDPSNIARRLPPMRKSTELTQQSHTSDSSTSSTAPAMRQSDPQLQDGSRRQRPTGPLSPRRTAELAGRTPGLKGKGVGREGSDGTPSMGSSFSDLDDASVTQSALEEALASNMQAGGGMASRMSSISQALRSKYL